MIKAYRGKTEKVFAIVSLVCVAAIVFGLVCEWLELMQSGFGYIIFVGHGVFYGLIAIPVFLVRRLNRLKIYEDRILLPPAARRLTKNGKKRLSSKALEICFDDIARVNEKIVRTYDLVEGELKTVFCEFNLKNGDVIDEPFHDLNKAQREEVFELLYQIINNRDA